MSPDELADELFAQARNEISTLSPKQVFLYGYVAAARGLPDYLEFARQNPGYGNADLASKIASEIRALLLGNNTSFTLGRQVKLLDERYVPNTEDFGSECMALEAALALVFLYKFSKSNESENILEIFRGIVECILMSGDAPQVLEALTTEQVRRLKQYELIKSDVFSEDLLNRCLAINEIAY